MCCLRSNTASNPAHRASADLPVPALPPSETIPISEEKSVTEEKKSEPQLEPKSEPQLEPQLEPKSEPKPKKKLVLMKVNVNANVQENENIVQDDNTFTCECGTIIKKSRKSSHLKSKKHIELL